jgi:hypothetical protein
MSTGPGGHVGSRSHSAGQEPDADDRSRAAWARGLPTVRPPSDAWTTVRGRGTYGHFRRVLRALSRQPEYRATFGPLPWSLIWLAGPLIYVCRVRPTRPYLISIERDGVVLGALTVTRSGQLANLVVLGSAGERRGVLRRLCAELDRILAGDGRAYYARTFDSNRTIRAALARRGFVVRPKAEYVVTVPLGPLAFSWIQRRSPRVRFLTVRRLLRYERPAQTG